MSQTNSIQAKVVVLGATGVGKTCLVNRLARGRFVSTQNTIGGSMEKKMFHVDGHDVMLNIWDTAGQERFRSMAPMYYRNADAALLCYDVADVKSLATVNQWKNDVLEHANEDVKLFFVGNKCDLRGENGFPTDQEAIGFSKDMDAKLYYTSAKLGEGINALFESVAKTIVVQAATRVAQQSAATAKKGQRAGPAVHVDSLKDPQTKGGCC